jgi:hypothetical protein
MGDRLFLKISPLKLISGLDVSCSMVISPLDRLPEIPVHRESCPCGECRHESNKECIAFDCKCCGFEHLLGAFAHIKDRARMSEGELK